MIYELTDKYDLEDFLSASVLVLMYRYVNYGHDTCLFLLNFLK